MPVVHHIQAKQATDAILNNFKTGVWPLCGAYAGTDFLRVGVPSDFPSPDAAFRSAPNNLFVSFEFKPPTETKRGILTGVGQTVAYLQKCQYSFLIAPETLSGYNLKSYLISLFEEQIYGKLPVGLITYDDSNPSSVSLDKNIDPSLVIGRASSSFSAINERYWAKHQDLPIPLFHLLLQCYFLSSSNIITEDGFTYFWNKYLVRPDVRTTFLPVTSVKDCHGNIIKTPAGTKNFIPFEKNLTKIRTSTASVATKTTQVEKLIEVGGSHDNMYNSLKKNWVTFMKHLEVIDSSYNLTEVGFALYQVGLANGPSSKIFSDYFTKQLLEVGHHLDLIYDYDQILRANPGTTINALLNIMQTEYETRGLIKRNPNRCVGTSSKTSFLKYERIIWNALNLLDSNGNVNWKSITAICALPDLV